MPSKTLSYFRSKYPQSGKYSDEELTLAIGQAYPKLLDNDEELASEYNNYKNPQGFVENFTKSAIASTVFDNAAAGFGVLETVSKPFNEELSKWMRQLSDRSAEEGAELRETGDIAFGIGFDRGVNQDAWASKLGSGAGSLAPMLATGGAGAAVGLTARAASVAGMAVATLQSYGSTYQQARKGYEEQGLSAEEAAAKAITPAAKQATLDAVLMAAGGQVAKRAGLTDLETLATTLRSKPVRESIESVAKASGFKSGLMKTAGSAGIEGAEEGASGFVGSYVIARHSYDPSVTLEESVSEAWDSFTVGSALGGAGDVVSRAVRPKSPEELAKRNTIRKTSPATAAKLDELDARNALIPDEAAQSTDTRQNEVQRSVVVDSERGEVVQQARESGKLPLWWDRYDSEGVDASGEVPTGLRYADQETVDRFIETQEAYDQFSQFRISEIEEGYEVFRGDELLNTVETKDQAEEFVRKAAVSAAPESVQQQISDYKQLTRTLSAIDEREKRYKTTLETSKQQQQQRDNAVDQPVSDEDKLFVAQTLGIPVEELPFTGMIITQEMVDKLRFAPQSGLAEFVQQAEVRRQAQAEQIRQTPARVGQELAAQKAEIDNLKNQARAITSRIEAQTPEQRTELPPATPRSSQDLSEFAEIALSGNSLNPTQAAIVGRLQDRKSALIVNSIGETNPDVIDATIAEIKAIDRNLANVLPVNVTPPSGLMSYEDLQQMQRLVSEPPRPPAVETEPPAVRVVDDLTVSGGELSADLSSKLGKAVKAVEKRFGSKLGLRRFVIRKMPSGAGVASAVRSGITDAIFIDPERLEASIGNSKFKLDKAIEEEMLHNLDGQALTLEYARLIGNGAIQKGTTIQQFINDYFTNIAVKMTYAEVKAARKIYGEDFIDPVHQAQEFVRQLVQKKHTNEVTEDARRSPLIRVILEALSNMLVKLNLSKGAKAHLDRIDQFLLEAYESELSEAVTVEDKQLAKVPMAQRADVMSRDIEVEPAVVANAVVNEDAAGDLPPEVVQAVATAYAENSYEQSVDRQIKATGISLDSLHRDIAIDSMSDAHIKQLVKSLETGKNEWNWTTGSKNAVIDALRRQNRSKRGGGAGQVSLDAPAGGEGSATVGELVPDPKPFSPTTAALSSSDVDQMTDLFNELDPYMEEAGLTMKEKVALRGVSSGLTLKEVTELLGMSEKSVASASKWYKNATSKLSKYLSEDSNSEALELFYQIAREGAERSSDTLTYASSPKVSLISDVLHKIPDVKRGTFRLLRRKGWLNPAKVEIPNEADQYVNLHQKKIESDAFINSRTNVINQTDRRLRQAIRESYSDINDQQVAVINSALAGDQQAMKSIPAAVADVIKEMRDQIDGLSRYMLDQGWVSDKLHAKIDSNIGTYLARSYRIFDDKKYVKNLDPEIFANAVSFIEGKLRKNGVSPAEAQAQALTQVKDLLAEYSGEGGRDLYMRGKLGAKDLSLFTNRKDLAPEIRALMGEYKDPIVNYARSVSRMVHFVGRQKLLNDMKQEGMGKIFFEKNDFDARNAAGAHTQIGGRVTDNPDQKGVESKTEYGPLAGLYTTEDIAQLINNYETMFSASLDGVLGFIAKLNVRTKAAATLGSVMTHARNIIGQPGFALLNGLLHRVKWADVKNAVGASWGGALGSDRAFQEYYNKMTRLGLTGEETTTSELRRVLGEHNQFIQNSDSITEMFDKGFGVGLKRFTGKLFRGTQKFYRASDEIGKIVIFEAEKRRLSALPTYASWSEAELENLAAERVRGAVPTYSEIPPAVQKLRMQPAMAPFMSFAYESMRTQINNLRYAKEEYDNGNYGYAAERFAGHMLVTFGLSVMYKYASEAFGGVGEEEQEDFRTMLPFYERNADIYFSRDEDGKMTYRVLSYNNPYSATTSSILALMGFYGKLTDEGIVDHVVQASKAVFEPFTSETMLAQAYIDWSRNTNQYGGRVYNPQASSEEIAGEFIKNFGKPFMPGTAQRAWRRWYEAATGKTLRSGEKPELSNELMAEVTGVKRKTVDYQEKLMFIGYRNNSELSDANGLFNYVAGSRGEASANEMQDAYADANRSRLKIFKKIARQVNAARLSGLSDKQIAQSLVAGKMSKQDVSAIMKGRFMPMQPSPSIIKRAREAGHPIPMRGINALRRQYLGVRID